MQSCIGGCQGEGSTGGEGGWNQNQSRGKKFEGKCYNWKKKGHMAKDCHFLTQKVHFKYGNAAIEQELNEKELETEEYQNLKWFKAIEDESSMCQNEKKRGSW